MVEATNHHPALGPVRQVDAGLLNVGYADIGPGDGRVAVLLHGWPYDLHSYLEVAPLLAAAGYRVVVPYLRGFGTTLPSSSLPRAVKTSTAITTSMPSQAPADAMWTSRMALRAVAPSRQRTVGRPTA